MVKLLTFGRAIQSEKMYRLFTIMFRAWVKFFYAHGLTHAFPGMDQNEWIKRTVGTILFTFKGSLTATFLPLIKIPAMIKNQ